MGKGKGIVYDTINKSVYLGAWPVDQRDPFS